MVANWWDVAEGIGGLATALAFGGTIWALGLQRRQLRLVQKQLDAQELAKESAQADLVSAWVANIGVTGQNQDGINVPGPVQTVVVKCRNASQLPVWDGGVIVRSEWVPEPHDIQRQRFHVIAPNETLTLNVKIDLNLKPNETATPPPVEMRFTDSGGTPWRRSPEGRLEKGIGWDAP